MNAVTPAAEMCNIIKRFGGIHAVEDVSLNLFSGEVVGVLGHNGAGKSCLIKILSGAMGYDSGKIRIGGNVVELGNPIDARLWGIETVYQTLALADHLDASANLFLGRELRTRFGMLDNRRMKEETRRALKSLNPNFKNITEAVMNMSGGQRQVIAIARAIYFNARIVIMDEPTAALGPSESEMVAELIEKLCDNGIAILLVSHDMDKVCDLCDRIMVMKNGRKVGEHQIDEVNKDDILSLIIRGELPEDYVPRN